MGGENKPPYYFDPECRVCFISVNSPPLLSTPLFPSRAPLAPSVRSNHCLGEPDKLRGRHQHLGVELKCSRETVDRLTSPTRSRLSTEAPKGHTVHSWSDCPVCVSLFISYFTSYFNVCVGKCVSSRCEIILHLTAYAVPI